MIVMPANNSKGIVHYWAGRYPGKIGWLLGTNGWRTPPEYIPYALDNGRFISTTQGLAWEEKAFMELLDKAMACERKPLWVVVPDVVGDAQATFAEWDVWAKKLEVYGIPLAMAAQDGMTPDDLKQRGAEVCFLGGTTSWKRNNIWKFCHALPRVHVGRVNTERWLWECDKAGAESCDGTGWFRGCTTQLNGLKRYLSRQSLGLTARQKEIAFADTFLFPQGDELQMERDRQ